jgi:lysophospholipid acyltransferase (LPLAT)-like uncharacterized protein
MKLRHPALIKGLGFTASWALRLYMGTLHYRYRPLGPNVEPTQAGLAQQYIYALWHENMLLPAYHYSRPNISVLISRHADGQLLAEVCRHLRVGVVRGSSTRGGVQALRRLLRLGRTNHLALTPDGPRGPRRRVQPGLIYLAARTGLPIVVMGVGYDRPWRLRSWDRFAVPRPGTLATTVTDTPIAVPSDLDRDNLEKYRNLVERELARMTEIAEGWAAGRTLPPAAHRLHRAA